MTIVSDVELPELLPAPPEHAADADVRVVLRPCPVDHNLGFKVLADGTAQLQATNVAVLEVSPSGREIAIGLGPKTTPLGVRSFLYGSAFALLLFRRGLMPLHGACLRIGNSAIVLSGDSGAGKSTLATALMRNGHPLLSDDLCAVDLSGETPHIYTAFPRIKLTADTAAHFQLGVPNFRAPVASGGKSHFCFEEASADAHLPVPLSGVISLAVSPSPQLSIERLSTMQSIHFVRRQVHRAFLGSALGYHEAIFRSVCDLTRRTPVFSLRRPLDLARLPESVAAVERLALELAS
jgi:hypothetical protein